MQGNCLAETTYEKVRLIRMNLKKCLQNILPILTQDRIFNSPGYGYYRDTVYHPLVASFSVDGDYDSTRNGWATDLCMPSWGKDKCIPRKG